MRYQWEIDTGEDHGEPWRVKAAAKRANILKKIPPEWRLDSGVVENAKERREVTNGFMDQFFAPDEISILSLDTVPIVEAVRSRKYTAERVTRSFCKAAAIAHQINPCLLEFFPDIAIARARQLDQYIAEHGKPMGPLHGLPVSLKDQFHVKNVETSMGYVGWIGGNMRVDKDKALKVESELTFEMLSLGAVLYCKTSVPQSLMIGETMNHIIGRTLNPHNRNLSCGGSSGGEGVVLALRASTIGFGTDIGGSVRIPASFCGVYGLKPSAERLSYRDAANTTPAQTSYKSSVGILATSLDGIELMLKSIQATQPWLRDPAVAQIPYRQDVFESYLARAGADGVATNRPLKFGIVVHDGIQALHPPVKRGLEMARQALEAAGHKLVNWEPPPHIEAMRLIDSFFKADGAKDIWDQLERSGEPILEPLKRYFTRRDPLSLDEYQNNILQGIKFEERYADYWNSTGDTDGHVVDAILTPMAPHAAVIPGKYYSTSYTQTYNMLNYSAAVIPVTKTDKELDKRTEEYDSYQPLNPTDQKNWEAYDAEMYHGAPVAVQIVGRKYEEEKVLAITKIVDAALKTLFGKKPDTALSKPLSAVL